ncbi:putative ABC transport system permease protein [Actinopolymorpha cephalotaxi]|uniref:ABC transport system permease protein n=1 Tax=Actinopolymorpha cephalotaxi TaxID=504797 RepID=A0A1I2SB69_9ACTN|nr:ABC transporter permease [Actinopolymorpha cephalotaxi]NYH83889.1 putative ABC transport system permease protein [Actinopolymorpha cephalotaxi]SFG47276.1 putative ABC transport system permease protein [Actinopolymorpha cephalotaxi]
MSRILLVGRLAVRDLRRRPGQAALLLLALAAATTTLTVGLVLQGVTDQPNQRTRAVTAGPDVVAGTAPAPGRPADLAELRRLAGEPGVVAVSGPYPYTQKTMTVGGRPVTAWLQGRDTESAPVDRPALTAGEWTHPGGAVLEAGFAKALGIRTGDRVDIGGRPFNVAGLAVTAASGQYPKVCFAPCWGGAAKPLPPTGPPNGPPTADVGPSPFTLGPAGLIWLTEADTRSLAGRDALGYVLNVKLADEEAAPAFAAAHVTGNGNFTLMTWQDVQVLNAWLTEANQFSMLLGSWLLGLIALASIVVLVGTRMADQTRRVGLLKAVGATPELVAAVLLVEHLVIALLASVTGLAAGRLLAPVLTTPSAGLLGRAAPAPFTVTTIVSVMTAALGIAAAATFVPAVRAARTSTMRALAGTVRPPRRRPRLIALSARLPVPLLLALRIAARRPRRTWLGVFAVAVTITGVTCALATRAHRFEEAAPGLDPRLAMTQGLLVITVMLAVQAVVNTICLVWATTLDTRPSAALARALGATPAQISGGLSSAQVLPALAGALLGVACGLGLAQVLDDDPLTVPPLWQLAAVLLGTGLVIAACTALPARIGAVRPPGPTLDAPRS